MRLRACVRVCVGQIVRVPKITEQAVTHVCTGGTCFASRTGLSEFPQSLQADGGTVAAADYDLGNTFLSTIVGGCVV